MWLTLQHGTQGQADVATGTRPVGQRSRRTLGVSFLGSEGPVGAAQLRWEEEMMVTLSKSVHPTGLEYCPPAPSPPRFQVAAGRPATHALLLLSEVSWRRASEFNRDGVGLQQLDAKGLSRFPESPRWTSDRN